MADESILIEVKDGVDKGISANIRGIGTEARIAQKDLNSLQRSINGLNFNSIKALSTASISASAAINKLTASQQQLASVQAQAAINAAKVSVAQEKAAKASIQSATAAQQLAAETTKAAKAQIDAQNAALRLVAAQDRAKKAAESSATTHSVLNTQLDKSTKQYNAAGLSIKQYNAALRGVPAQITDIVVSLQGGQRPLTVLLQQGGQLKDMFGGIGPAFKALASSVMALVNPVTILAAIVATLAIAFYQGSSEVKGFQNQVTLTGNALSITNSQFSTLQNSLSDIATKGKAAEVLTAIASTGQIAADSVKGIATAAILMEKATGQAVSDTVAQFVKLADAPASASAELNKQYNYLTASVYEQIKALEEQGRKVDAANLAEQTYAAAMTTRSQQIIANAGLIERAWKGITGAAKSAWDAMLNVDREATSSDIIAGLEKDLANLEERNASLGITSGKATQQIQAQIAALKGAQFGAEMSAKATADYQAVQKAGVGAIDAVSKANETYASKQAKTNKELKDYRNELDKIRSADPKSKLLDPKLIAGTEKGIRDKNKDSDAIAAFNDTINAKIEALKGAQKIQEQIAKQTADKVASEYYRGMVTELEYINITSEAEKKALTASLATAQAELDEAGKKTKNKKELATLTANVGEAEEKLNTKKLQQEYEVLALEFRINAERTRFYNESYRQSANELADSVAKNKSTRQEMEAAGLFGQALADLTKKRYADLIAVQEQKVSAMQMFDDQNKSTDLIQLEIDKLTELKTARDLTYTSNTTSSNDTRLKGLESEITALQSLNSLTKEQSQNLNQLSVDAANLRLQMGGENPFDLWLASLGKLTEGYKGLTAGMSESFGTFFMSLEDGFANSIGKAVVYSEDLSSALRDVARSALSELIGSLVKLGIQYAANALLGQSIAATSMATQTGLSVAAAATTAAAWATPAALVSLASYGANSIPAIAGITATSALTEGLALASVAGFESGGYTGNMASDKVAGVVHGNEFVMDSAATNRIGVGNLEALRTGAASLNANSNSATSGTVSTGNVSITVENTGTPQTYEQAPGLNANEVRLIARDVVSKESPGVVAATIQNPNSQMRKSLNAFTNTTRR